MDSSEGLNEYKDVLKSTLIGWIGEHEDTNSANLNKTIGIAIYE